MKGNHNTTIVSFLLFILCFVFSAEEIVQYGHWLYLAQLLAVFSFYFKRENNFALFFSPSFLTILYLNISFCLGHIVVSEGIGFDLVYYRLFARFENVNFITFFFLFCSWVVFIAFPYDSVEIPPEKKNISRIYPKVKIIILLCMLFALNFVSIDLSFLGGSGDFSYVFKLAISIVIVKLVSDQKLWVKLIYYILIIAVFLMGNFNSKREIMYVLILMLFYEVVKNRAQFKLKFRQFFFATVGFSLVFTMIIVSSIMRGYGNFKVKNPLEAATHVLDYVSSDYAMDAMVANFELAPVYGNSSNAINYVYSGDVDILYGSTFYKFFFMPIPRSIFEDKPNSMIDVYTERFSPSFRALGGSFPIVIYAESFWNFYYLAPVFLFLLFRLLNIFYLRMVRSVFEKRMIVRDIFLIYLYVTIIQVIRGSGLEIWLMYGLISLPAIYFILKLFNLETDEQD